MVRPGVGDGSALWSFRAHAHLLQHHGALPLACRSGCPERVLAKLQLPPGGAEGALRPKGKAPKGVPGRGEEEPGLQVPRPSPSSTRCREVPPRGGGVRNGGREVLVATGTAWAIPCCWTPSGCRGGRGRSCRRWSDSVRWGGRRLLWWGRIQAVGGRQGPPWPSNTPCCRRSPRLGPTAATAAAVGCSGRHHPPRDGLPGNHGARPKDLT